MTGHASDLHRYLHILAGANPAGRLIEIRSATAHGGMRQTFTPATRTELAARTITTLAASADVYVGVLLRHRRAGGRHACERSHLAFIETDDPSAIERLKRFAHQPTMTISSSPGHLHLYWQLQETVDLDELEQANRRLAHHLGGDLASIDASRILRPPTSWNRKRTPPTPVELLALQPARRYQLDELTAELTDPSPRRRSTTPPSRAATSELDQLLLAIPAATYVPALTGRQPNRAGKICCPFHHDDSTPSLQLYDHGWYCFACRLGGSIYDFGALLFGLDTRGHQFLQLRQRLATKLLPPRPVSKVKGSFQS
jgi:RepB DNA-primase from phage plasmid/CHC2 zinc finger